MYKYDNVAEYLLSLFRSDFKGICVDIGAYGSGDDSNSYPLELKDWTVFCIEPNPNCMDKLINRKHVYQLAIGSKNKKDVDFYVYNNYGEREGTGFIVYEDKDLKEIIKVDIVTLNYFLDMIAKVDHLDVLSIDTEGWEMEVLKGVDLNKWKIKVICIENWFENEDQHNYLINQGYTKLNRIEYNNFYGKNI
jgi:FkbM family methyltransferase